MAAIKLSALRLFLGATVITTVGIGTGTAAAARSVIRPASLRFEAELPETDGFAVYLRAEDHRHVKLEIESEGESPYTTLDYSTTGRVRRHGIDVDFGRFGHIDLHFVGKPKRYRYPFPNCKGKKADVQEYGAMEGTIEFQALGGIVKLDDRRVAEAHTSQAPKRTCTPKPQHIVHGGSETAVAARALTEEEFTPLRVFLARAHTLGRLIDLYAFDLNGEVVDAAATSTRRFGAVLVETTVHAPDGEEGPGKAAELTISGKDPRPDGAKLTVGTPFSGTATFDKKPGAAPTWLGSLKVKIPGEGTLPLAGPEFNSIICAYEETKRERACERMVAPPHVA
ncbi:MAG TPA: hypothetical protein VH268_05235 [Solirubrobacterales bacterium]|jgi:hypothetical protein|nr:hypothetical protein [Solirubrobacterales bacterium]